MINNKFGASPYIFKVTTRLDKNKFPQPNMFICVLRREYKHVIIVNNRFNLISVLIALHFSFETFQ